MQVGFHLPLFVYYLEKCVDFADLYFIGFFFCWHWCIFYMGSCSCLCDTICLLPFIFVFINACVHSFAAPWKPEHSDKLFCKLQQIHRHKHHHTHVPGQQQHLTNPRVSETSVGWWSETCISCCIFCSRCSKNPQTTTGASPRDRDPDLAGE